jgi:hypothetical protein
MLYGSSVVTYLSGHHSFGARLVGMFVSLSCIISRRIYSHATGPH